MSVWIFLGQILMFFGFIDSVKITSLQKSIYWFTFYLKSTASPYILLIWGQLSLLVAHWLLVPGDCSLNLGDLMIAVYLWIYSWFCKVINSWINSSYWLNYWNTSIIKVQAVLILILYWFKKAAATSPKNEYEEDALIK